MKQVQLFLLHFAGGNCYSFQFLQPYLRDVEFIPLELPGRGRRYGEELLVDLQAAADDFCRQISSKLTSKHYVIYGHSMGALLALKVAGMLEARNQPPAHVVVSGNAGPGTKKGLKRHLMEKSKLKEELKSLGGVPQEFLESEELFDFYEAIMRADFELAEKDNIADYPRIKAPIYAIMGDAEEGVADIHNWAGFTSSFSSSLLPGGHFFIHKHPVQLAGIIKSCCRRQLLQP
ncbi:thioesterase II family protein [Chitinophaga nivalis]|uniref:Alpha/beta fold hydrolase n=1 Tax=Chitinophaga nivalis TaxID=2991709 RepID=A0ABT3IJ42_9BACT|nr:alpha/beta fold hydrolase [Chitinophaga nivalis]MCW3466350.1 alpha/beta fold hydrolase [Chitinophaga nivalis]MCW3483959.1 alpha/beta fold hydrolase [Chitinophaga nivalis]